MNAASREARVIEVLRIGLEKFWYSGQIRSKVRRDDWSKGLLGRTGRAERAGIACTFVTGNDRDWVLATERMIGAPITRRKVPGFELNVADRSERPRRPFGKNVRGMRSGSGSWSRRANSVGRGRGQKRIQWRDRGATP